MTLPSTLPGWVWGIALLALWGCDGGDEHGGMPSPDASTAEPRVAAAANLQLPLPGEGLEPVVVWKHGAAGSLLMFYLGPVPSADVLVREFIVVTSIPDLNIERVMHGTVRLNGTGPIGGGQGNVKIIGRPVADLAWGQVMTPEEINFEGLEYVR